MTEVRHLPRRIVGVSVVRDGVTAIVLLLRHRRTGDTVLPLRVMKPVTTKIMTTVSSARCVNACTQCMSIMPHAMKTMTTIAPCIMVRDFVVVARDEVLKQITEE